MSGTQLGGQKAAITNKAKHGDDFYIIIGAEGGKMGHTGGFFANRELASQAGRIGGLKSRRTGIKNQQTPLVIEPTYIDLGFFSRLSRLFHRKPV